jgi:HEAT repeat protein
MVDERYGSAADIMELQASDLIGILQDCQASLYAQAKACRRLAVVGDKRAVPALADLLDDPRLSHYARLALEAIPDSAAGLALRDALGKVEGKLLVGVINSLGQRRDTKAIEALAKLLRHDHVEVAQAAAAALARIRPPL